MADFFVQFLNGVTIAMAIYLIASGLSLVFGVSTSYSSPTAWC